MNFDFSGFHPGHTLTYAQHGDRVLVICSQCRVAAELEGISGKITVADAHLTEAKDRMLTGALSAGVPWVGLK